MILTLLISYTMCGAYAENDLNASLDRVEASLSKRVRFPVAVIQYSFRENQAFEELELIIERSWKTHFAGFIESQPTDIQLTIYVKAAQHLQPKEYLEFLDSAMDVCDQNNVNLQIVKWMLFPSSKQLRGIWNDWLDDPKLGKVAIKAQGMFSEDKSASQFFGDIIKKIADKDDALDGSTTRPDDRETEYPASAVDSRPNKKETGLRTENSGKGSASIFPYLMAGALTLVVLGWFWFHRSKA